MYFICVTVPCIRLSTIANQILVRASVISGIEGVRVDMSYRKCENTVYFSKRVPYIRYVTILHSYHVVHRLRACVRACVCAYMRECVCVSVCVSVCVCDHTNGFYL